MNNLVLVRHGQSKFNLERRFTGFYDVELTPQGKAEANYAGKLIKHGIPPRRACQSAVVWGVTDDQEVQKSITEVIMSIFE